MYKDEVWKKIDNIPNDKLWQVHKERKEAVKHSHLSYWPERKAAVLKNSRVFFF